MKINFFKILIFFLILIVFTIIYLSIFGIETKKFNQEIKDKVIQSNKDLNLDLTKVKLTLDPLKFRVNAKTIGATIYYLNRPLELEYIQTKVSLGSFFKNKIVSSNFEIGTKSILLKDFVKFIRSIKFKTELLILETIIKDGYIILDLNFNLDQNGKIKNDFEIKGKVNNGKIKLLKNIEFKKINFLFNIKEKKYSLRDIKFSADGADFNSDILKITKLNNNHQIEGKIENLKSILPKKIVKLLSLNLKNLDFEETKFSTKNNFTFEIDKSFKVKNLKLASKINFNQMIFKNKGYYSEYFPDLKKKLSLDNHNLELKFEKNILSINGEGKIQVADSSDKIEYFITKKGDDFEFETNLNIKETKIKNQKFFKKNFPKTKDLIDLKNHNLNIKFKDKKLYVSGEGNIRLQKDFDNIQYLLIKNEDEYQFETDLNLNKLSLKNQEILKINFPLTTDLIDLKDHKLNLKYLDKKLYLNGEGGIRFENDFDNIKYSLIKYNDKTNFTSEIDLKKIRLKNKENLKKFFPSTKDLLDLKNHKVKINYKDSFFSFSGRGQIKIDKELNSIDYFISREASELNFDINIDLKNTDFKIENINYKKNNNLTTNLSISGSLLAKEKFFFNNISILDKNNKIKIKNLFVDKNNLLIQLDEADFDYIDFENKNNQFAIKRQEKDNYKLSGSIFNANTIVTNLLNSNLNKENKFLKNNVNININLNEVYLDNENLIKNLQGVALIEDNKVIKSNFSAYFDNKHNIIFKINTKDNKKITKLYSSKAKPLVKRYKFIKGFEEGYLDFESVKQDGKSISNLKIYDFKLKEVPTLTKLLTLASLQGIADILTGEGIRFNEFEMRFNNKGYLMTIDEIYAIGPAISILMNGYIEKDKLISLRGTLVPATTINKTVSKIPLLGKILVGKKTGEGVFGVSFKIKGPPKNLETTVNPIKTLTPRFITRTLEKLKKN